jgi:hypothetical protein
MNGSIAVARCRMLADGQLIEIVHAVRLRSACFFMGILMGT